MLSFVHNFKAIDEFKLELVCKNLISRADYVYTQSMRDGITL